MEDTISNPLVSIGIVTYNRPSGLRNALMKLTRQTYTNLQIIVSDDNPDGTDNQEVVQSFSNDTRIQYFKKEKNEGMNLNFTYALSKAEGEYFMWAADDDDWDLDFVENCVNELKRNDTALLCIPNTQFINEDYDIVGSSEENIHTVGMKARERFRKYFLNSKVHNVGFYGLFKTNALKGGYLPNFQSNDRLILLELSLKGEFIQHDERGFYYNISGSSKGMKSYLNAMKLKSRLMERAPHFTFNYIHVKSILFKWRGLNLAQRLAILKHYFQLIKENGYYLASKQQIIRLFKNAN